MRAPRSQRWFAFLALVVAWVGVSFGAFAHGDGHPHRFCAEHGTIEEGASPTPHPAFAGDDGGTRAEGGMLLEEGMSLALEHTECPLATLPLRDALRTVAGSAGVIVAQAFGQPPSEARPSHVPQSPLSVAPKASPPSN